MHILFQIFYSSMYIYRWLHKFVNNKLIEQINKQVNNKNRFTIFPRDRLNVIKNKPLVLYRQSLLFIFIFIHSHATAKSRFIEFVRPSMDVRVDDVYFNSFISCLSRSIDLFSFEFSILDRVQRTYSS